MLTFVLKRKIFAHFLPCIELRQIYTAITYFSTLTLPQYFTIN